MTLSRIKASYKKVSRWGGATRVPLTPDQLPIIDTEVDPTWTKDEAIAAVKGMGKERHSEEEVNEAWQFLIDTGDVWLMDGWFSRTAQAMIDSGDCTAGRHRY